MRTFAPLRRPGFRRLFASQAISGLGDWLDFVALLTLVAYVWRSDAFALAAVTTATAVPWIVIGPFAGLWADRLPSRVALVGSDLLRAACVFGYLFAGNLAVLVTLLVIKTSASTLFLPAQRRVVRLLSRDDDVHAAVSLTTFTGQFTKVVGPALGGLVVAAAGVRGTFAVDAVTFLVSAAILGRLRVPEAVPPTLDARPSAPAEPARFWADFRAGITFLAGSWPLLSALAGLSATVFIVFTFDTLSPLALGALGIDESLLGLMIASVGFGAVGGTLLLGQWGDRLPAPVLMSGAQALSGVVVTLIGLAAVTGAIVPVVFWLAAMVLIGGAAAGIMMSFSLTVQRETPVPMIGRVSGAAEVIPTVAQLTAPMLGATVAAAVGVGWVFAVAGGALTLLGLILSGGALRRSSAGPALAEPEPDVVAHIVVRPEPAARIGPRPPALFL